MERRKVGMGQERVPRRIRRGRKGMTRRTHASVYVKWRVEEVGNEKFVGVNNSV